MKRSAIRDMLRPPAVVSPGLHYRSIQATACLLRVLNSVVAPELPVSGTPNCSIRATLAKIQYLANRGKYMKYLRSRPHRQHHIRTWNG